MNIELSKYKNGASCAFSFTFDDGCYLDSSREAMEIFEDVYNKTGVKIKATVGITVKFMHERLIDFWREGIKKDYFDIASHTIGHDIAFCSDTPYEARKADAEGAQRMLREMFPGEEVNTFIFAGGSRDNEGTSVLAEHYIACRAGGEGINQVGKINWLDVNCLTAMLKRPLSDFTDYIDKTKAEGGWGVQMNHWITHKEEDVFHSQSAPQFREECNYLGEIAKDGSVWTGSFYEVSKYLRRYEQSSLNVQEKNGHIFVEILTNSDTPSAVLDTEMTICIDTDKDILLYERDGNTKRLFANENGKIFANTYDFIEFEPII